MWIKDEKKKEYIPFDSEHTDKVFWDGEKGWAVKQKDGSVHHVDNDTFEKKMLRELDPDTYWKMRNIEDAAKGLTEEETVQVKKILKEIKKSKKKEKEEDD